LRGVDSFLLAGRRCGFPQTVILSNPTINPKSKGRSVGDQGNPGAAIDPGKSDQRTVQYVTHVKPPPAQSTLVQNDKIRLLVNRKPVEVALSRLSQADRDFMENMSAALAKKKRDIGRNGGVSQKRSGSTDHPPRKTH
jgi:hypothetical protein